MDTAVAFIITIGLVIIIHELGHFSVCKWTGIYVRTFSIGFGPKILKKRFGETEYALSIIPFGGYVKMAGEGVMGEIQDTGTGNARKHPIGTEQGNIEAAALDSDIPNHRKYSNRSPWQRLAVVLAGPIANLVLAFVIYTVISMSLGEEIINTTKLGNVVPGSPAAEAGLLIGDEVVSISGVPTQNWNELSSALAESENDNSVIITVNRNGTNKEIDVVRSNDGHIGIEPYLTEVGIVKRDGPAFVAGLKSGDKIVSVDGQSVTTISKIADIVGINAGNSVSLQFIRNGELHSVTVIPEPTEVSPDSVVGLIGIERAHTYTKMGFFSAVANGAKTTIFMTTNILSAIVSIKDYGLDSIGGPIRVAQVAGDMLRWSFGHLMQFVAFFSINLFLLNLLPIPVLDGGQVLFISYELITRRQANQKVQAILTQIGVIMLMLLMVFVVTVDLLRKM